VTSTLTKGTSVDIFSLAIVVLAIVYQQKIRTKITALIGIMKEAK